LRVLPEVGNVNYLAQLPEGTVYLDLYEALKARKVASPDLSYDLDKYRSEERDLINPALEKAGYRPESKWFDGERDSFGPLTRCVHAIDPDGTAVVVVYG
jgi:hypothetical protein